MGSRTAATTWIPAKLRPWLPVLAWICVIAVLGGGVGQHEHTSRFLRPFLRWLLPDWRPIEIAGLHEAIRTAAHVGEYAVVAVLSYRALLLNRIADGATSLSRAAAALPTLGVVLAVALADEGRQALLTVRTGSASDVALDLGGGTAGLLAAPWLVRRRGTASAPEDSDG